MDDDIPAVARMTSVRDTLCENTISWETPDIENETVHDSEFCLNTASWD